MGEICSISRSHFVPLASEPLDPRGRECLACAAVFLAKSDFRPCLSDLAHNGAVPRYRVGVFMEARTTVTKHRPPPDWPDAGRRQRYSQRRPPASVEILVGEHHPALKLADSRHLAQRLCQPFLKRLGRSHRAAKAGQLSLGKSVEMTLVDQTEPGEPGYEEVAEFRVCNVIEVGRISQNKVNTGRRDMGEVTYIAAPNIPAYRFGIGTHLTHTAVYGWLPLFREPPSCPLDCPDSVGEDAAAVPLKPRIDLYRTGDVAVGPDRE